MVYVDYSVIKDANFIDTKEFTFNLNNMELEETILGLLDNPMEYNFTSFQYGMDYTTH